MKTVHVKIPPVTDAELQAWIESHLETVEAQRAREMPSWIDEEVDRLERERADGISRPADQTTFGGK